LGWGPAQAARLGKEVPMMRMLKLIGLGAALVILALAAGNGGQLVGAQEQPPCTVTVTPGQSIQEAIDAANPGDVICLSEGEWRENLVIKKGLTLRGAGRDRSIIKGKYEGKPVIRIESDSEIKVTIEGLTIAEAKLGEERTYKEDGIEIGGKAKVIIRDSEISGNGGDGIWMEGSSQATISDSQISENGDDGIDIWDSSQATISGSQISGNGWGIEMWDSSQAKISDSQISGNSWDGIEMGPSSQAEIRGSRFLNNGGCGIEVETEEASVRGGPNEMRGNGADLCGYAPASIRKPLVPQIDRKELSVPGDYPSIQEAIDALAPGGTITLAPGTYEEGLTIWKPLTIRGAGKEKTVLKPLPNPTRKLIVSIIAGAKGVALEGLTITGSAGDGLFIYGEASLKGLQISGNGTDGIGMWDSSQAEISGSEISGNGYGIWMRSSSRAEISGSQISGNGGYGISMWSSSQATISGSEISGNDSDGIVMGWGSARAEISISTISGNGGDGISMWSSSQVTISGSEISGNDSDGIVMWGGSSRAEISGSQISGNRKAGIVIGASSQAVIRGNKIFENKGYGVVLYLKSCGFWYGAESFEGKVEGSANEIHDNSKGDVCPEGLEFLKTSQGGCYGKPCD